MSIENSRDDSTRPQGISRRKFLKLTRNSARSCDMESELGTLEAGKLADVLVVDGDPLADVKALTNPRLVLREGKLI